MINSRFIKGDILRCKKDQTKFLYVINNEYKSEIDRSDRYPEEYEWYKYECYDLSKNEKICITSYNEDDYDVIMHRFIFEDIHPFMQVLVYNVMLNQWVADLVSSWGPWNIHTLGYGEFSYNEVIPYNDLTKDLINTSLNQTVYHNFSTIDEVIKFASENNDLSNINMYKSL